MKTIERLIDLKLFRISIGIIPLVLFTAVLVYIFTKQQEETIHRFLLESAAHASHSVDRAVGEQIGLLNGLAASLSLDDGNFDSFRINAQRLIKTHPEWRTVIVTDRQKPVFNMRFQPGQNITPLRDPRSLQRVWQTKKPYVGDLSNGHVAVRVPVVRDDQVLYTLVVPVDPQFFLDAASKSTHRDAWGYIIVGGNGTVIVSSANAPADSGQVLSPIYLSRDLSTPSVGDMLYTPPSPIKTGGWRLILFAPESMIRTSFEKTRWLVYAGGFLAVALTVIMVLAMGSAWAARHEAIGLRQEIDARLKIEDDLRQAEFSLKEAQCLAEIGSWKWDIASGRHIWSEEIYRIYGRDPGLPPALYPEVQEYFTPESWSRLSGAVEETLSSGASYRCDAEVIKPDGSHRWITTRGEAVRDSSGKVTVLRGTVQDITERKNAEEKLKESEKKFRDLFHKHTAVKLIIDPDSGNIVDANEAAEMFYGWSGEQLRKMRLQDINILSPEQVEAEIEKVKNQQRIHFEFRHQVAGGSIRDVAVYSSQLNIQGKSLIHSIVHDISERKQVEREQEKLREQLTQAQKMESVGQLAGGVAHDYNNMLSVIIGYSEMAMDKTIAGGRVYDELQEILKAAKRSVDITRQLLAFARKQTISPEVLELNTTVESMLKMLRRLIGEDIELAWLPGADLWSVKMDPSQIDQILANLCVNARDAIAGVGKITIETDNITFDEAYCTDHFGFIPGEYVVLVVSDDGCGINKETLEHIFEPFFTTKGIGKGTGLGLATVYGIVKQNNGFINVYSEPGKGTTFRLYLPRHRGKTHESSTGRFATIPQGCGETVLLVEDEPAIRKLGIRMLENLGYKVMAASTPSRAMTLAEENAGKVDLLITDVVMPEMNGRDLADQLHRRYPDIKILFMSGYTSNVIAHRGVLDDGVNFIPKPFSKKDLAVMVHKALG